MSRDHTRRLRRLDAVELARRAPRADFSSLTDEALAAALAEASWIPDLAQRMRADLDALPRTSVWTAEEVAAVARALEMARAAGAVWR